MEKESKTNIKTLSSEPSPEAVALGNDPALLYKVKCDLDKPIAGEDKNKLHVFLDGCTTLSARPLGCIITGDSSAGKSHLLNHALMHFKKLGIVEDFTRLTEASPDRLGKDYNGRILIIQEIRGMEKAQATLRVWISEGKLRLLTTMKDEKGNITTGTIETKGIPVFMTTTTNVEPDEEMVNRLSILSIDETQEQTDRILEFEAAEYEDLIDVEELEPDPTICDFLRCCLLPMRVGIPFARLLKKAFPKDTVRVRRDFKKLLNIIYAVTFIHQNQRPQLQSKTSDNKPFIGLYVAALPVDFYMAWAIADKSLKETLLNLQARSLKILSLFAENIPLTTKDVAACTDLSQNRARDIMENLINKGYLVKDESEKTHKYFLKKKGLEDTTISKIVASIGSFGEKELKNWIERRNLITKSYIYSDFYIDPITGEKITLSTAASTHSDIVIEKMVKKAEKDSEIENQLKDTSVSHIVPSPSASIDFLLMGER